MVHQRLQHIYTYEVHVCIMVSDCGELGACSLPRPEFQYVVDDGGDFGDLGCGTFGVEHQQLQDDEDHVGMLGGGTCLSLGLEERPPPPPPGPPPLRRGK